MNAAEKVRNSSKVEIDALDPFNLIQIFLSKKAPPKMFKARTFFFVSPGVQGIKGNRPFGQRKNDLKETTFRKKKITLTSIQLLQKITY